MLWVSQNMKEFPEWINTKFIKYRIKQVENKSTKWDYRPFQKFFRDYLSMDSPYRGILLYHGLGSGKTCSSIAVAEHLKTKKNVIILCPGSLRTNYITALMGDCGVDYTDKDYSRIYTFISYNAPNTLEQLQKISSLDNHTIIIEEVHNLVSMMVTKSKKGPEIYRMLMEAKNVKIVGLSGTPIINYPFEVALLSNILRGYIHVPTLFLKAVKDKGRGIDVQLEELRKKLITVGDIEYIDVYQRYVYLYTRGSEYDATVRAVIKMASESGISLDFIEVARYTLYPEDEDEFHSYFIQETMEGDVLKNVDMLKRRMLGIVSYYRGGKPIYYPTVNPVNFEYVAMSPYQFQKYKEIREVEMEKEKSSVVQKMLGKIGNTKSKNRSQNKISSLFKVFSRQFSNFTFPEEIERPFVRKFLKDARKKMLNKKKKKTYKEMEELEEMEKEDKRANDILNAKDKSLIDKALKELGAKKETYLVNTESGLKTYSPKMSKILENMDKSAGLIFVYSAFRSLEGIGVFALVLEANGWERFDYLEPDNPDGAKKFAIYSGEESEAERKVILETYNSKDNMYGEKLKALLVTSAGAEGLDMKNIRQVHVMEPYWHDVRTSQVIGRANRYLSHADLPEKDRTVDVYRYFSVVGKEDAKAHDEKQTTDEYMYEIAQKKMRVTEEIKRIMKDIAVDCKLNAVDNEKEIKCFSFGLDAKGLAYKANIKDDFVYEKTEMKTKTVHKKLEPMFLDDDNNLVWADKKKKSLCYFHDKECTNPLKVAPKNIRKVGVDMETLDVYDILDIEKPIRLGKVRKDGKIH